MASASDPTLYYSNKLGIYKENDNLSSVYTSISSLFDHAYKVIARITAGTICTER